MKQSIQRAQAAGAMIGSKGLPKDAKSVILRDGKVVSTKSLKSLEQLLDMIGKSDDESFEAFEQLSAAPVAEAQTLVSKHAKRLKELVKGDSAEARGAAIRALAKRRDLDDVPVLIYALEDEDPAVVQVARDGLRRISCKLGGVGLPDYPAQGREADVEKWKKARDAAVKEWKKWYLAVRPDADFDR
jgi:hypothetical protein